MHVVGEQGDVGFEGPPPLRQVVELGHRPGVHLRPLERDPFLGVGHQFVGPLRRLLDQAGGLVLRFSQCGLGRPLGEHERPAHPFVGAPLLQRLLGSVGPSDCLPQPCLQGVERLRHPVDELVDLVGAISPPLLGEANLPQPLRRQTECHAPNPTEHEERHR